MKHRLLTILLLSSLLVIGLVPTVAQDTVTISVAVPEFIIDGFPDEAIERFEAQYPNIRVNVKPAEQNPTFNANGEVESFLDNMEAYASEADVLLVSSPGQVVTEVTRAGILLDMSPLILSDPDFNSEDFYFSVWQSFQWDGGIWGVPMVADVVGIAYQPSLFDQNNLPYPDSWFSLADVDLALRELTTYDDDGNVQTPAIVDLSGSLDMMFYALSGGQRVVDDLQFPSAPDYSNPVWEELVQTWADLRADGIVPAGGEGFQFLADAPVLLVPAIFTSAPGFASEDLQVTTLPGNFIGVTANGLSISSGTQYPQEAYEFVKFVSKDPQLSNAFLGVVPARRSLQGADEGEEGVIGSILNPSDEIMALVNQYIDFAIPPNDLRYGAYMEIAVGKVANDGIEPATAIQETEQEVLDRLAIADERGIDQSIIVATPPPDIIVNEGEVSLSFGISGFTANIPNEEAWNTAIDDFVLANPDVVNVDLTGATIFSGNSLADMSEQYDCFYTTGNVVQNGDISLLLNISPLISSDPNVDPSDFVNGILNQVNRDGQTYGLPLDIQPQSMVYDTNLVNQGGAFPPYAGWTVTDFENMLRTLKIDPEDPAPFGSQDLGGGTHLINLIAAYGGLPLDYRTSPITIDYTNPASIDAIRQVLDLAKEGYIAYDQLANFGPGGGFGGDDEFALYTQVLNSFTAGFDGGDGEDDNANNPQVAIPFPAGTQFSAVSFDIGALYISSSTDFADACYRFVSSLSTNPALITAMPARRSVISDPQLATLQSPETVQLYTDIAFKFDDPNTIPIPSGFGGGVEGVGDALLGLWLIQAFDRYVLEDADLEAELEEAQLFSENYRDCAAAVPAYDPAVDQAFTYFGQFFDCAIQVDPSLEGVLPNLGG